MQYLGNRLEEIKKVYSDCQRYKDVIIEPTEEILGVFVKGGEPQVSSWYQAECSGLPAWHTDCSGNPHYKGCIISSYPNQALCFYPDEGVEIDWPKWDKVNWFTNNRFIEKLLENKRGKVFVPNSGDVYYLDKNLIHKSNPLSLGIPHICMRIGLYAVPDWQKRIYDSKE
jgi:hypothetical protein